MSTEINSVSAKPQEHGEREGDTNSAEMAINNSSESQLQNPEASESLLDQEQRIERVWSDLDRKQYRQKIREFEETVGDLRHRIEEVRTQADSIWDHFVSLSLEMIMEQKRNLIKFLEDLQLEVEILTPEVLNTTSRIDTLLADIAGYQRLMGRKVGLLESMTHRISTHNHLNMMMTRVVGLESQLLGRKIIEPERKNPATRKLEVNIPSDLLYLRVRLRTTRASMLAAHYTKQVADTSPALYSLLFRAERMRSDLTMISTRMTCLNDQAGYWLAYLDMSEENSHV